MNTTPVSPFVVIVLSTRGGVTKSNNAANISAFVPITALKNGKSVDNVTIKFERSVPSSPRPDRMKVTFEIEGRKVTEEFKNQPGGGK